MVKMYCPLAITGAGRLVVQFPDVRSVADCRVHPEYSKPAKFVGHAKMTFPAVVEMLNWGTGNEKLNIVPLPELPPQYVVPYSVLPDKINPA